MEAVANDPSNPAYWEFWRQVSAIDEPEHWVFTPEEDDDVDTD